MPLPHRESKLKQFCKYNQYTVSMPSLIQSMVWGIVTGEDLSDDKMHSKHTSCKM